MPVLVRADCRRRSEQAGVQRRDGPRLGWDSLPLRCRRRAAAGRASRDLDPSGHGAIAHGVVMFADSYKPRRPGHGVEWLEPRQPGSCRRHERECATIQHGFSEGPRLLRPNRSAGCSTDQRGAVQAGPQCAAGGCGPDERACSWLDWRQELEVHRSSSRCKSVKVVNSPLAMAASPSRTSRQSSSLRGS